MFGNLQKLENKLSRSCRRLHRSAQVMLQISGASSEYKQPISVHSIIESESLQKGEGYHVAVSEVVDGIVTVGNLFSQVVDLRLTRDLGCILDTVEGGGVPAKVALKSFANILMDGGSHLCRLASEIRTVRGMLGVILDAKEDYLRILSLRCLATVLCVGEAVKDFDRVRELFPLYNCGHSGSEADHSCSWFGSGVHLKEMDFILDSFFPKICVLGLQGRQIRCPVAFLFNELLFTGVKI